MIGRVRLRDEVARAGDRADELGIRVEEQIRRSVELVARSREVLDRMQRRSAQAEAALDAHVSQVQRVQAAIALAKAGRASPGSVGDHGGR
jgi:hypothetical protein